MTELEIKTISWARVGNFMKISKTAEIAYVKNFVKFSKLSTKSFHRPSLTVSGELPLLVHLHVRICLVTM